GDVAPALEFRVATYNVHYGFGEDWRYAPEAMADAIAESGADVVALQEVSVGLASAYGTDLARWLGRRLGMRVRFAPTVNGTLGDAVLSRLPVVAFRSVPLPPDDADRKQVAVAEIAVGPDTVRFLATHFGLTPEEQAVQTTGVLEAAGTGPSILAGDLNAGPDSDVARRLREAGFRDAFELAGPPPPATRAAPRPCTPAPTATRRDGSERRASATPSSRPARPRRRLRRQSCPRSGSIGFGCGETTRSRRGFSNRRRRTTGSW